MAKINSLYLLVKSLSKGERRYFKLYTSLQQGSKDYLYLFDLIDEGNIDIEEIKSVFAKEKKNASFEATSKYLFKVITDCMLHVRTEKDITSKLATALLKVNILFEKSLYEEGFKQLQKIQEKAEETEQYIMQFWAARLELFYISNLNFFIIKEPELIQKQMKVQSLIKYANNIHQHISLHELLRHRLLYKGNARTKQQKEELNDLVVSELNIISNPLAETFESYKTHLLFQAHYFLTISDHQSALKTFYELNELFEDNMDLWAETPTDYFSTIEGILDALHTIKKYNEMAFFIEKIEKMGKQSLLFEVTTMKIAYVYKIAEHLEYGDVKEAELLKEEYEQTLFKKIGILDINKQAEIYLYTALIYLCANKISKAHYYLNQILLESKLYYSLPVYRTFRLIHLLIHYELDNHEYIEYEIRSIKRGFTNISKDDYLLEKIVFKFLQQPITVSSHKGREAIWQKYKKQFNNISEDKYEIQILKIFDFPSWVEAKICRKSLESVLKEKRKRIDKLSKENDDEYI